MINEIYEVLFEKISEAQYYRKGKTLSARKHEGDDRYSYAVFVDGQSEPVVSGLDRGMADYHMRSLDDGTGPVSKPKSVAKKLPAKQTENPYHVRLRTMGIDADIEPEVGDTVVRISEPTVQGKVLSIKGVWATVKWDGQDRFKNVPEEELAVVSKVNEARNTSHCSNCGGQNPELDDGYTTCCNEPMCDGGRDRFGFPDNYVTACCWAKAEEKFKQQGKQVEDGMYRL